jgi:hypothetical protein
VKSAKEGTILPPKIQGNKVVELLIKNIANGVINAQSTKRKDK